MFNLVDHEREIRTAATNEKLLPEEALAKFVYNLAVMRDHYTIFDSQTNFRVLGQEWNKLTSSTRNQQREACLKMLKRSTRGL